MVRVPLILVIAMVACAPEASSGGGDADSAWGGVRHLSTEPQLQIGSASGEGPEVFGSLSTALFGPNGRIVAGDSQADQIQVFDSLGRHVATLGEAGEGPGEFRDLGRIYSYRGDSIAAFDFGLSRTLLLPLGGGESRSLPGVAFDTRAPVLGALESGSLLAYQTLRTSTSESATGWDSLRVVLVPGDGGTPRDVGHLPGSEARGAPGTPPKVLAARGIFAASPHGFYWARSDRYEILYFDTLGTVVTSITRPVEPASITEADEQEYREATLAAARERGGERAAAVVTRQLQDAVFASTRPLFGSAFVDKDQRLWISDLPWPSRYDTPHSWSVFDADGQWLGDVEPPSGLMIQDAAGDNVLGIWRDDLGVRYLRVYRLEASQPR